MKISEWKTGTVDIDRASEFTGDDVDQFSDLIDLGAIYEFITVHLGSTITSGTIQPYVQRTEKTDEVPVIKMQLDDDATGSFAHADTAATTIRSVTFRIGGYQYIRIRLTGNQAADETLYVRGFNREPMST